MRRGAMEYEAVIGLEVHAQLKTKSKVFCGCSTQFGAPPNTQVCPVCLGLPGVLPVLNRRAVEYTLRLALALGCEVAPFCRFARKNYFYPDLPKGYQISQYELPLAQGGSLEVVTDGARKRVSFHRIHMEEDAGKLIHGEHLDDPASSYVDLNRTGVPLLEIVTAPDLRSAAEASDFLQQLRTLLQYLDICDANMEEGSLRCDANVSIRPAGSRELGTKVEVKNMNSFRFVRRALDYEVERQRRVLEAGGTLVQETRLWDSDRGVTLPMRTKEYAHDYRYFPEPDLVPLVVDREWQERIRAELPELPLAKHDRFVSSYGLPDYDAGVLTASRALADYFEETVRLGPDRRRGAAPKAASNWVMGEVLRLLNERKLEPPECPVTPAHLAGMLKLVDEGVISGKIAKAVFEEMADSGQMPEEVVRAKGLTQVTDVAAIESAVERVLAENADQVAAYRAGKDKLFGFFMGQTMKVTGGKANPAAVQEILRKKLAG
ncbi:MAG: Asp-tRNA(Asn)/Glu-tRNA(Gln) amidotransferase subunit GatB [Nitrospinota bacterium]